MTAYLLDTNVVSELTRDTSHPRVIAFLAEQNDVWLSAIVIHELEYGLRLLPRGRRSDRLRAMQSDIVSEYENRILPLDKPAAERAAQFRAPVRYDNSPKDSTWSVNFDSMPIAGKFDAAKEHTLCPRAASQSTRPIGTAAAEET